MNSHTAELAVADISSRPVPGWFPTDNEMADFIRGFSPVHRFVYPRYPIELLRGFARLFPSGATEVLDVGAGNGVPGSTVQRYFPDCTVRGVDVVARAHPESLVRVSVYDGSNLPFPDRSFDISLLSNVIHHVPEEARAGLLAEVLRVTRRTILVKDHLATGALSRRVLGLMDLIGNAPFGGMVRAEYLDAESWKQLFSTVPVQVEAFGGLGVQRGPRAIVFRDRLEIAFRLAPEEAGV